MYRRALEVIQRLAETRDTDGIMRTSGQLDSELLRNVGEILATQGTSVLADAANIDAQETIEVQ